MRMTPEHFNALAAAIKPSDTRERRERYEAGRYPNAPAMDLDTRYRWDLYWEATDADPELAATIREADYKDRHIDTALSRIVPGIQYALSVSDLRETLASIERPEKLIPVYDDFNMDDA